MHASERTATDDSQFPQTPARHTLGLTQVVPQAPQLTLSVCRLVQVPAQMVSPACHESPHTPALQTKLLVTNPMRLYWPEEN